MPGVNKKYMSIAAPVLTVKFSARNNGIGARQERASKSATAYISVR